MSLPQPSKKQVNWIWLSVTTLAVSIFLVLIGFFVMAIGWVVNRISAVIMPLALALILAYIFEPVVQYLVKKRISRPWAIALLFLGLLLAIVGLLLAVVPDLVRETHRLSDEFPKNLSAFQAKADDFLETNPVGRQVFSHWRFPMATNDESSGTNGVNATNAGMWEQFLTNQPETNTAPASPTNNAAATARKHPGNPREPRNNQARVGSPSRGILVPTLQKIATFLFRWMTNQLSKVTTWAEFLLGFILTPIYLFYFLLEKETITRHWSNYLPLKDSRFKRETIFILKEINQCIIVFFRGQVLVALCVGTLLTIGYSILGLNYAVLVGVIAGVLGIVPYLGTIVGLLIALTIAGVQFGDWTHPLIVMGIAATVKFLEDLVISPRIMGQRSGLHPMVIILAVMIGTTLLGGFIGALIAIPLTAALRTLMFRYVWKKDHARAAVLAEARAAAAEHSQ